MHHKTRNKVKSKWQRFKSFISRSSDLIGSLIARGLFISHATVSTFIAVASVHIPYIYLLFLPLSLLILESFATLKLRKNREWKWFTPSIAIYQLCTVPSIWLLEYRDYSRRVEALRNETTSTTLCNGDNQAGKLEDIFNISSITTLAEHVEVMCYCGSCIPIMEQMLLLLMIVGRWLLPRGEHLSRDQKAQLLLVNIAIASDILELFEMMKEDAVKYNAMLVTVILTLWSCSLIQFAIVSTATKQQSPHRKPGCFETEMWALVTLLFLDDAPFLTLRLVCIINYNVVSYTSLFFTAKNCLVLALDVNRLIALSHEASKVKRNQTRALNDLEAIKEISCSDLTVDDLTHIRR